MADLCLCEYTDHGHCGIVTPDGDVDNDATLDRYASTAVAQARAGAHMVAPSGMMDGQVGAIRKALDGAGFRDVPICAYSAKYASAFYGPFREAAEGAPKFGDRATHQQDPANALEALKEVELDLAEGADMVMVKPALQLPRRHPPGRGHGPRPGRRLPGQRRVRDGRGGRGQRLGGPRQGDHGDPHVDPPGGRERDPDLLGHRGSPRPCNAAPTQLHPQVASVTCICPERGTWGAVRFRQSHSQVGGCFGIPVRVVGVADNEEVRGPDGNDDAATRPPLGGAAAASARRGGTGVRGDGLAGMPGRPSKRRA